MASSMAPIGSGKGNTINLACSENKEDDSSLAPLAPKKRISASIGWFFTFNNYRPEHIDELKAYLKKDKYIFGEEVGKKEGTPHLQGVVKFRKKTRPSESIPIRQIHWEKIIDEEKAIEYCQKDGKIHTNVPAWKPVKNPMDGKVWYPWQKELQEILEGEPHERQIIWYYDQEGGKGKTSFAKHLVLTRDALVLGGKGNDIKCGITKWKEAGRNMEIFIFDFSRTQEGNISYQALEEVKNGLFFSGKYESTMCTYNIPHVICFANFSPNTDNLSADRWNIKTL